MPRKIERRMIAALIDKWEWSRGNTAVRVYFAKPLPEPTHAEVLLHGNHIATLEYSEYGGKTVLILKDSGWQTNTTKSRLNALLEEFPLDHSRLV